MTDWTAHRGYQEPTQTDMDQVIRVADATKTPAYSWSDRLGKFEHLAGPEIPDIDRARKNGAAPAKDDPAATILSERIIK